MLSKDRENHKMPYLLKICLIFAIAGTFLLLLISQTTEPKLTKISDINKGMLDNFVKISGTIQDFDDKESIKIASLQDETGIIDIVIFEENILALSKGMKVEIIGKVSEYNGKMQVNAEEIREIDKD